MVTGKYNPATFSKTTQFGEPSYSERRWLLFLIPLLTTAVSFIFFRQQYPFYMAVPDPSYIHLFNGMNLAGGHMEVGNIDNPGTTIQCFAAIIIFIKHLFSASPAPLFQDVIINSESYLLVCSLLLVSLFISGNYLTGAYIFRHTGSIGLSMVFQITPLININIIQRAFVLAPESFIIIVSTFFMAYLFVKAPENGTEINNQLNGKTVFLFGILSGFLIASKYTCIPVVLLVLFILKENKHRLLYIGTVIVSFFFFIIPALPKFNDMYKWVWSLASHDGIYGKGEERVINPSVFLQNIKGIFITDTIFTSIYIIITIAFLFALISLVKGRKNVPFIRTISGAWLSITLLILVVAKHCDFHYLIFAECCFPLGMVVSYKIFSYSFSALTERFKKRKNEILYSVFAAFMLFLMVEKVRYIPFRYSQPASIDKYISEYKNTPFVISVKNGLTCGRREPAFYLGYLYSGSIQMQYADFLKTIYPDTYIHWDGLTTLTYWNRTIPITEFLAKNKKMLIYLKGYDDTAQVNLVNKFLEENSNLKYNEQEIYKDSKTQQNILLVSDNHE